MPESFVGTSGFASPRSPLPKNGSHASRDLLASYASRFSALEMDSSFQRSPCDDTVRSWRDATSDGMAMAVHVTRDATHVRRLAMPDVIARFIEDLSPLGSRLRCLLFTTPPTLGCDVDLVGRALDAVPPDLRTAWEFHHPSWACPEVMELLVERNSTPAMVETIDTVSAGEFLPGGRLDGKVELPFFYVRLRKERYRARELIAWGDVLGAALDRGRDVFAFFKQSEEAQSYATALGEVLAESR